VIEAILELSGNKNVEVKYDESKPSMIPVRHIDISLAQEKLGWTPQVDLRAGLAKTIEWYKSSSQRED
jgi:GDP-L-fucose synthase